MSDFPDLYFFKNTQIAQVAFTHRSSEYRPHNERLEWLGDSLLNYFISTWLYSHFSSVSEGSLSLIRTRLIETPTLAQIARQLNLTDYLHLGASARDISEQVLANTFEAYIGAIYVDGGDWQAILRKIFHPFILSLQERINIEGVGILRDAKTQLQENLQKQGLHLPTYTLITEERNKHPHQFTIACYVSENNIAQATAGSKAEAEQVAAQKCLQRLLAVSPS